MFENQAKGWHGSYSTVGRNSAEKYPMILIKDKILKDKCEKKVIKDYFNTDDDWENDKIVMDDFDNKSFTKSDYSNDVLNMSKEHYAPVMKKIFEIAKFIEKNFGGKPQDIEGGIIFKLNPVTGEAEPEIHIWQTRDVHLIKR